MNQQKTKLSILLTLFLLVCSICIVSLVSAQQNTVRFTGTVYVNGEPTGGIKVYGQAYLWHENQIQPYWSSTASDHSNSKGVFSMSWGTKGCTDLGGRVCWAIYEGKTYTGGHNLYINTNSGGGEDPPEPPCNPHCP